MSHIERQKEAIKRVLEAMPCVEMVYFTEMDGDRIRRYVDMDYNGGGKEVLVVNYKPELCAYSNSMANWEYTRPDEIANIMEI